MRLIDADALIKTLRGRLMKEVYPDWDWLPSPTKNRVCKLGEAFKVAIEQAPTVDAVEVVRCKDCIFFQPYIGEEHKGDCEELVGLESCVYEDDFCSYGCRWEE